MDFFQVDVFAGAPYQGNPLAVFPDAADLGDDQMQSIAAEMNLSETTFVTATDESGYDVRIFTPRTEMPFAGHPTIGTTWVLRHLGIAQGRVVEQHSGAGTTPVHVEGDTIWFERKGSARHDLQAPEPVVLAEGLGLDPADLGNGELSPALYDAGLPTLVAPLQSVDALGRCMPRGDLLGSFPGEGVYCFTRLDVGRLRARSFFPGVGVMEDPATGSAAAALGIYFGERVGRAQLEIDQGVEMGRPSRISVRADIGRVEVGGRCELTLTGRLEQLP